MKISVIIPTYNEIKYILQCLRSLNNQTVKHETIVVDDGSTDKSFEKISHLKESEGLNIKLFRQNHLGPGVARNLGVKNSSGEILVFVDADMTFANDFLEQVTKPIIEGKTKGTFSRNERVANWSNVWAKSWNYNQNLINELRIPQDYPNTAPVFRAILKSEFDRVGGFTNGSGWVDDWSLSNKLGYKSSQTNALYYHYNPASLSEAYKQAKWIGKNVFLTGNKLILIKNLLKYNFLISLMIGTYKSLKFTLWQFFIFKVIYDFGMILGILSTLFTTNRNK